MQRYDRVLADNFAPIVAVVREGLFAYLPSLTHPVRHGVHNNTAFAVKLAIDYTRAADDQELKLFCTSRMAYWFGHDTDYGARWEPSGEDFLSPALTEAEVMAAVLPPENFALWLDRFFPRLIEGQPANLFTPVDGQQSDRSEDRAPHRPESEPRLVLAAHCLGARRDRSAPRPGARWRRPFIWKPPCPCSSVEDFNRAHWLASFAVYALTE